MSVHLIVTERILKKKMKAVFILIIMHENLSPEIEQIVTMCVYNCLLLSIVGFVVVHMGQYRMGL